MGLGISVLRREDEDTIIMELSGSLDTETYLDFKDKSDKQFAKSPKALVLDLKNLEYISSMGVSAVLDAYKIAGSKGISFLLSNMPAHIEHVFKIIRALPGIQVFESVEEADKYLAAMQKRIKDNA